MQTTIARKTKAEELRETLVEAFPAAFDDSAIEEVKEQEDYPGIIYWHKSSFNINLLPNDGDPFAKKFRFMEEEDGNHITQQRLDSIRAHLADAFKTIKANMPSLIIEGWRSVHKELALACYADLRYNFPEFMLCKSNWKVNAFLTAWYPTITRFRPKKGGKGKDANAGKLDDIDVNEGTSVPSKRPAVSDHAPIAGKKARVAEGPMGADWLKPITTPGGMPMALDPLYALLLSHMDLLMV